MSRFRCANLASPGSWLCLFAIGFLFLSSCATVPKGSPETGYAIHGYVVQDGESAKTGASEKVVTLKSGDTGDVLARTQTDWSGEYKFLSLDPGFYVVNVGDFTRDVLLGQENEKVEFDLSSPDGTWDHLGELATALIGGSAESGGGGGGTSTGGAAPPTETQGIVGVWAGYEDSGDPTFPISLWQYVTLFPDGTAGWTKSEGSVSTTYLTDQYEQIDVSMRQTGGAGADWGTWEIVGKQTNPPGSGYPELLYEIRIHDRRGSRGTITGLADPATGEMQLDGMGLLEKGAWMRFERR